MKLDEAAEPLFAKHETFSPRYGWFKKAYDFSLEEEKVFTADDAPIRMGVGKNMVPSIRFWGEAAKIIKTQSKSTQPTLLGHTFFADDGLDPFMEDPGTPWIVHWLLLAPPTRIPIWWIAFNSFRPVEFRDENLEAHVNQQLDIYKHWLKKPPVDSSQKKDIIRLFHTYGAGLGSKNTKIEDLVNCPLREIGIMQRSGHTDLCRFVLGPKPGLKAEIITYIVFDYISRLNRDSKSMTLHHLASAQGGPGLILKLSEDDLSAALTETSTSKEFEIRNSASGIKQLFWNNEPKYFAPKILEKYYGKSLNTDFQAGHAGDVAALQEEVAA